MPSPQASAEPAGTRRSGRRRDVARRAARPRLARPRGPSLPSAGAANLARRGARGRRPPQRAAPKTLAIFGIDEGLPVRRRIRSRIGPSRNSLATTSTIGRSTEWPGRSRAISCSCQSRRWLGVLVKASSPAASSRATRRGISSRSAAAGGAQHQASSRRRPRSRVGDEAEARDMADRMALDHHLAPGGDGGEQLLALRFLQPAHQMGGPAVDEAGGEPSRAARRRAGPRPRGPAPASAAASCTQSARAAI